MNEVPDRGEEALEVQPEPADATPASFGARLRWERERAGLTLSDLAARLRLHPNQVRALEQENLAVLPEAAYVRGFVRSYARLLKIDAAPLMEDLSAKLAPGASVVEGMVKARDYSPVRAAAQEHTSRSVVLLGGVLLLLALGALGWYATRQQGAATRIEPPANAVSAPAPAAPTAATQQPEAPAATAPAASTPAPDPAPALEPVAQAPLLKLRFTGNSWAEVKDAEGKVLLSQHLDAGAEPVIEGTPPFYVVIGDANHAAVEVRGEPYDLAPHTRQNVARFTVN